MLNDDSSNLVEIPVGDVALEGELIAPEESTGVVIFAHGSGSSRKSPRNTFVAEKLRARGLATLLFDLLTEKEDQVRENRFDISRLTDRLVGATEWIRGREGTRGSAIGYFGASTGAAAALQASVQYQGNIEAVVSRGGRVDMASEVLNEMMAPTLFIVGGEDEQVLELNREVYEVLTCEKDLHVVEGAGHLFEGSGELEEVADQAGNWFAKHLG